MIKHLAEAIADVTKSVHDAVLVSAEFATVGELANRRRKVVESVFEIRFTPLDAALDIAEILQYAQNHIASVAGARVTLRPLTQVVENFVHVSAGGAVVVRLDGLESSVQLRVEILAVDQNGGDFAEECRVGELQHIRLLLHVLQLVGQSAVGHGLRHLLHASGVVRESSLVIVLVEIIGAGNKFSLSSFQVSLALLQVLEGNGGGIENPLHQFAGESGASGVAQLGGQVAKIVPEGAPALGVEVRDRLLNAQSKVGAVDQHRHHLEGCAW